MPFRHPFPWRSLSHVSLGLLQCLGLILNMQNLWENTNTKLNLKLNRTLLRTCVAVSKCLHATRLASHKSFSTTSCSVFSLRNTITTKSIYLHAVGYHVKVCSRNDYKTHVETLPGRPRLLLPSLIMIVRPSLRVRSSFPKNPLAFPSLLKPLLVEWPKIELK